MGVSTNAILFFGFVPENYENFEMPGSLVTGIIWLVDKFVG
jgi:hypothetical protein